MTRKKILVTGGSGLVGSHLIAKLIQSENEIVAIRRPHSASDQYKKVLQWQNRELSSNSSNLEWINADLMDEDAMDQIISGVDEVYHCAAWVSFNPRHNKRMLHFNVDSTAQLVNRCLQYPKVKFCHVSSIAAFGKEDEKGIISESSMFDPEEAKSGYAMSKYLSEMEVWRGIAEGLKAIIVNPGIILGPGDWSKGSQKMFPTIMKGLKYYTPGITAYVDVRDVATIMVQLMNKDITGERFCLSSGSYSYKQIFQLIANELHVMAPVKEAKPRMLKNLARIEQFRNYLFGTDPLITRESARSAFNTSHYDASKIKETLNYSFFSIEETIAYTAKSFLTEEI